MLKAAAVLDMSDEAGRKRLCELLNGILVESSLGNSVLKETVFLLGKINTGLLHAVEECINSIIGQDFSESNEEFLAQLKSAEIFSAALESSLEGGTNSSVVKLMETLVFKTLDSPAPAIRKVSLNCLALCCLNDELFAQENLTFFCKKFKQNEFQDLCLKFLLDWISIYSLDNLEERVVSLT